MGGETRRGLFKQFYTILPFERRNKTNIYFVIITFDRDKIFLTRQQ